MSYEQALVLPREQILRVARERRMPIDHPHDPEVTKFLEDQLCTGYLVELEHGTKYGKNSPANVTNNDTSMTLGIVWAHVLEDPIYYRRLEKMEKATENLLETLRKDAQPKDPLMKLVKKIDQYLEPHRGPAAETPNIEEPSTRQL